MSSFKIYNTLDYPISIETTKAGCVGVHNGVVTVCCYYDNAPAGYNINFSGGCCKEGAAYGVHVQLLKPGGTIRYKAVGKASCPGSGTNEYHLELDGDKLSLITGVSDTMDASGESVTAITCTEK